MTAPSHSRCLGLPAGTRFELERQLAVGGMAEIFLAWAVAPSGLRMQVALKRMRRDVPELEYGEMFLDEVRLMERISHPNLVYVLDTSAASEHRYYLMEYLHGRDARQLLGEAERRGERLDLELALPIVLGASAGLHHAHELEDDQGRPLGIVHRDVSPANIFITSDGRVKVVDFGIASYAERRCETRVGIVKGKLRYMSPEQFQPHLQPIDRRSDVFALSTVLWELTVGRRPFESENDFAVLHAICEQEAPAPSSVRPDYPPELEAIVQKGLRRDRDQRFASADALRAALQAFADARRIRCSTTQVAARMARWLPADQRQAGARYRVDGGHGAGREATREQTSTEPRAIELYDPTLIDSISERTA